MTIQVAQTPPYCLQCDYPLSGLSARRCPECGRPFDLNDRKTFNAIRPISKVDRWLLQPDGILFYVVGWSGPAIALWAAHLPGFDWSGWLLADVVFIAFAFAMAARHRMRRAAAERHGLSRPFVASSERYASWAARTIAMIIILACFGIPFRVSFWISQPALRREIHQLQKSGIQRTTSRRWTGLFCWDQVEVSNWGIRFSSGSSILLYHPYHPPYHGAVRGMYPITNDWYAGVQF